MRVDKCMDGLPAHLDSNARMAYSLFVTSGVMP